VRALLLKGSLGRGEGDELSDIDLVIVCAPGRRTELWDERLSVAEALGEVLGLFREQPWQAPYTAIALYDGPTKVDLFFHDGEVAPDPWLREGYRALVDKADVAVRLARKLEEPETKWPTEDQLRELDANAWDWLWWMHVKLERSEEWLVYVELAKFVEAILFKVENALAGEAWRGPVSASRRLEPALLAEIDAALPRGTRVEELNRALAAVARLYVRAREEHAARLGVSLENRLMRQILARLGGGMGLRGGGEVGEDGTRG
jgi:predicted nucleotidyltransferase